MVLLLKNGPVNVNINEDEGMCEENGPAAKKPVSCLLLLLVPILLNSTRPHVTHDDDDECDDDDDGDDCDDDDDDYDLYPCTGHTPEFR